MVRFVIINYLISILKWLITYRYVRGNRVLAVTKTNVWNMYIINLYLFLLHFSMEKPSPKPASVAFKSTFASSPCAEISPARAPPLPKEPPPPLPPSPPPPLPAPPPFSSLKMSKKPRGNGEVRIKRTAVTPSVQVASLAKPIKFNLGMEKTTSSVRQKVHKPLKKSNVFGDEDSDQDDDESSSSSDNENAEAELLNSTKEQQEECLSKAYDYFDTLVNTEKKRKIIRFVRGTEGGGILPGSGNEAKPKALTLSKIISKDKKKK